MKTFYVLVIGIFLSGCSVTKNEVHTTVHSETQHHINENSMYFVQLVNFIRLNSNVKNPTKTLKSDLEKLIFNSGLSMKCFDKEGCYLIRPGFEGRIRIDNEYVVIYYVNRYTKYGDIQEAALIIYS